jgi:hypothetical protein
MPSKTIEMPTSTENISDQAIKDLMIKMSDL